MQYELTDQEITEPISLTSPDLANAGSIDDLVNRLCPDCFDNLTKYYDEFHNKIRYTCENCGFMISDRDGMSAILVTSI